MFEEFFANVLNDSFIDFSKSSQEAILSIISNKKIIIEMIENIVNEETLVDKCESYDFLDKLVFYSDEKKKIYARISVFNKKYANRIHYHRWHYTSYILRGGYTQYLYGNLREDENQIKDVNIKSPLSIENMNSGNYYTLHNSMIHSINAIPDTVSISIRGEALMDKFQVLDPHTGTAWWQYGQQSEAFEEHQMKRISKDILIKRIKRTCELLEGR